MKIIYLIEWEFCQEDGVIKKITSQIETWKSFGHDIKLFVLSNCKNTIVLENTSVYSKSLLNRIYFSELYGDIDKECPDIIYFRYSAYKPYLNKIFERYKIVIEINSNIISEKKLQKYNSIKDFCTYYYVYITNAYMEKRCSGVVSVTHELVKDISIKNRQKTIVIPNSINLKEFTEKKKLEYKRNIPNLVFIGSPNQEWHGIDKIIELAKRTSKKLNFHIIGLKKPVNANFDNMTFYGYLPNDDYKEILFNSDIGIGTLALHRKSMNEACPLKVREYLAFGLPIIIGYEDTAFKSSGDKTWILKLDNTEFNVFDNIEKIIEFSYDQKNIIVENDKISQYLSSINLEEKRLDYFLDLLNG